jgi:excisionase family DNA binding protein
MYYKVKEVAAELNVCLGAVYKAIAQRKLACHRFGGAIRISPEELQEYIEASRLAPTPKQYKHVRRIGG